MITGTEIRKGRQLLRWTVKTLAFRAGLRPETIERAAKTRGEPEMTIANLSAIVSAFEVAGVEFIRRGHTREVRLHKPDPA